MTSSSHAFFLRRWAKSRCSYFSRVAQQGRVTRAFPVLRAFFDLYFQKAFLLIDRRFLSGTSRRPGTPAFPIWFSMTKPPPPETPGEAAPLWSTSPPGRPPRRDYPRPLQEQTAECQRPPFSPRRARFPLFFEQFIDDVLGE